MPMVSRGRIHACEVLLLSPSLCVILKLYLKESVSLIIKATSHLVPLSWGKGMSGNLVSLGFSFPGLWFALCLMLLLQYDIWAVGGLFPPFETNLQLCLAKLLLPIN